MAQETPGLQRAAIDFVIDAHSEFRQLETRLAEAEASANDNLLAELYGQMETIDGYSVQHHAERLLSGLGFGTSQFTQPVASFSGGWRVRLNLAAALMQPSDLLLLDEPTNHLDLEATVWLEQWLKQYPGTLLLISHDRMFIDAVATSIISFEDRKLVSYSGNYSAYEKQRAERLALQQAMFEKQQRRKEQIEDFVRRFRAKATKAKQAQSRLKELSRMEEIAPAHVDSPFHFSFGETGQLPSHLLTVEDLAIGYSEPLVSDIRWSLGNDSRVGLLGFNGSGKSTLLETLAGRLPMLAGELQPNRKLRLGYYAQHQIDELPGELTALQFIQRNEPELTEQQVRDLLGGFDFRGERATQLIKLFSGGEKARLALARLVSQKPNLLLLDEPTNYLDLEMVHALTAALQAFDGPIVVVSHDRHLQASVVDEFYSIHRGEFREFIGDLKDYEKWLLAQYGSDEQTADDPGAGKASASTSRESKKEARQEAARRRERLAPLRKKSSALEKEMSRLGEQLQRIEQRLADESLYSDDAKDELTELLKAQGEYKRALEAAEDEWLEIEEELGEQA
jgi:ATP-binding cassette subfamily F protein 3